MIPLENAVARELALLNLPPSPWTVQSEKEILEVVIIGAGTAGMTAALALLKWGIRKVKLYDSAEEGKEGPWATYARMKILRSPKNLMGPALFLPRLTFQAWYEAQYGKEKWEELGKIPTLLWMDYLRWFRKVLKLPVENGTHLLAIEPKETHLLLTLKKGGKTFTVATHKLILATGREGFGGLDIPSYMENLSDHLYSHTGEEIEFHKLKNKRVVIIGGGASAFDAAGVLLEHKAKQVDILIRHTNLPNVNKGCALAFPGLFLGFFDLPDKMKLEFLTNAYEFGAPPPIEALQRIEGYPNVKLYSGVKIQNIRIKNDSLEITTNKQTFFADHIILGTGFAIDGSKREELAPFYQEIKLWQDLELPSYGKTSKDLSKFPYLGHHMEFLEKHPGHAPYLKHIYCFNYGANMSHGPISGDIPGISVGAERVAMGIVRDFFKEDAKEYYSRIKNYQKADFKKEDFSFFFD